MSNNKEDELRMLKRFPLLIPESEKRTRYIGYLSAGDEEFFVNFHIPNYPSPKGLSMQCDWDLYALLSNHKEELKQWKEQQSSLYAYLECLQNLIVSCLQGDKDKQIPNDSQLSARALQDIIQEVKAIGIHNVTHFATTCRKIVVKEIDPDGHTHLLTFELGLTYPMTPPVIEADLPEVALKILKKKSSLSAIYKAFVQQVNALQEFWKALDAVDQHCWVLDPEHPSKKDSQRRIMIGNNVSLQVTLDPANVKELPDVKFLGSEHGILPFQMAFAENMKLWSSEKGLIENIKTVLNISEFPSAPKGGEQYDELVHQGECAICVMMQLNGDVPSKSCDNEKCDAIYHVSCLHEWLQTVPTSKKAFNHIIGECPNCFSTISCQRPS